MIIYSRDRELQRFLIIIIIKGFSHLKGSYIKPCRNKREGTTKIIRKTLDKKPIFTRWDETDRRKWPDDHYKIAAFLKRLTNKWMDDVFKNAWILLVAKPRHIYLNKSNE